LSFWTAGRRGRLWILRTGFLPVISLDRSALNRVSAGNPDWLVSARAGAFDLFQSLAMPSSKEEVWRYVDLDFELSDFSLPTEPGAALPAGGIEPGDSRLQIVDGLISRLPVSVPDGVAWSPIVEHFSDEPGSAERYDGVATVEHDIFSAASRAFGAGGAHLSVAARAVVPEPLFLDVYAATPGAVSFPRVMIDVEDGAEVSVVVDFRSDDAIDALVVPELDVVVGANANLRLTVVQEWGTATTSLARVRIVAGRDAQVTFAEAGLGGTLARMHLSIDLEGRGSSARVVGTYFGDADQVLDYRYFMRHIGENTSSDMFLKGGVEDEALSIFTGMIRIEESAQQTNAFQTNRNLLLSQDAAAQSVPNLEILANDVKCGHGSTVGPLDDEQRYYLMSRGLDSERADRLQVRGFFEEALARFPEQSVAGPVRERINAKYIEAQEEGRV
jgi:Fe-S cluster assembly protein SufD